ncbi:hypothetical protein Droror1_Dr00027611 [Drosera rotundifolia]
MVNIRLRAGQTTTFREVTRRVERPPLPKFKGPKAPAGPSTTPVTPTVADAVRTVTCEFSLEEWDSTQQIRARRANSPVREISEDSEEKYEKGWTTIKKKKTSSIGGEYQALQKVKTKLSCKLQLSWSNNWGE